MKNGEPDDNWYYRKLSEWYPNKAVYIPSDLLLALQRTGKVKPVIYKRIFKKKGYFLAGIMESSPNHDSFDHCLDEGRIFPPGFSPYTLLYADGEGNVSTPTEEDWLKADTINEGGVTIRRLVIERECTEWKDGDCLAEYLSLKDFYEFEELRRQNEKEHEGQTQEKTKENDLKLAEAHQTAQELERQNKIQSYPLMTYVDAFLKRLDELPDEEVKGDKEQKLVALYFKLKQVLESNGQLSLEERELLGDHYLQGAEFDAVLKMWNDKIAKAKADTTLDDQQRKLTVGHLMAMMNKALQRLQED